MMLFLSITTTKNIGRATFPASILNINEPLVYGAPLHSQSFNDTDVVEWYSNSAVAGAAMRLNIVQFR